QVRYVWTNSTWQVVEDLKLVSDPGLFGRHIVELNGTNGAVVRSYVWGLDLSESLDGAGGVGGLLWVRLSGGPGAGVHFVTYDGNGNVWTLVSASTGTETARYEYGPFGEPLRLTGAVAGLNPFRFRTKRTEDGTGLVLYEYRAYSPALGRWLSRDPINEPGHRILTHKGHFRLKLSEEHNLYCALKNSVMNLYDADGRSIVPVLVVGGVSIAAALCIRSQYEVAHARFGDGSADPAGDSFLHCWTSCRISKVCGGILAQLAGLGKEGLDAFRRAWQEIFGGEDETGHGLWLDSLDDWIANQQCIGWESYLGPLPGWIGALCRRSCEPCCREKVGYHANGHD
ncbi:RHS repeat-associated core domain-containing protein, partial [Limisphaera ngatamarikiensis]